MRTAASAVRRLGLPLAVQARDQPRSCRTNDSALSDEFRARVWRCAQPRIVRPFDRRACQVTSRMGLFLGEKPPILMKGGKAPRQRIDMETIARTALQLGNYIRQRRRELGLTQEKLAAKVGVRQRTVSDIETSAGSSSRCPATHAGRDRPGIRDPSTH